MKMIGLMNDREEEQFKESARNTWRGVNIETLRQALRINLRMKQQYEFRIVVLRELISKIEGVRDERDRKSKQYPD